MNWKNVRLVLLSLLLIANGILISNVYNYYSESRYTDRETANDAVKLLEAGGITVSPDMLAAKNYSMQTLECSYIRQDYQRLAAEVFLGTDADGIYLLPDGIRAETFSGDTAIVKGDFSLLYTASGIDADKMRLELLNAKSGGDGEDEKKALWDRLRLSEESLEQSTVKINGRYIFVNAKCIINNVLVDGMECNFGFLDGTLVYAEGRFLLSSMTSTDDSQLLSGINILFSEKRRGAVGNVVAMEPLYVPYENAANERLILVPACRVGYADGTVSTVNAITGEKY